MTVNFSQTGTGMVTALLEYFSDSHTVNKINDVIIVISSRLLCELTAM